MPATKPRTPRPGRPRVKAGAQKAVMFRWPSTFVEQLHAMAAAEERSINTVAFRLMRAGLKAEGQPVAVPEAAVDTAYAS
jgi:hypothetical protein